jgi:hypothetical protein
VPGPRDGGLRGYLPSRIPGLILCRSVHKAGHMRALAVGPPHCGKSLQSLITIITVEPTATTTGQINGNSSSRPTRAARTPRVLFTCAKRQPATSIGHLHLAPSSSLIFNAKRAPAICQFGCSLDQGEGTLARSLVIGTCVAKAGSGGNERADCARRDSHAALIGHRAHRGR